MKVILLIISLPLLMLVFIAVLGLLISLLNGNSNLMAESIIALIISGGVLGIIFAIEKSLPERKKGDSISVGHEEGGGAVVGAETSKEATPSQSVSSVDTVGRANFKVYIQVSGVSHLNKEGGTRQECIEKLARGDQIWLEREPDNPYDRNAIRVISKYGQIGYVPRRQAAEFAHTNIKEINASVHSKGSAPNGLLGCTVLVEASAPAPLRTEGIGDIDESYRKVQFDNGRAYPHPLLLEKLANLASEVFSPEDDIRILHSSFGFGKITEIQGRRDNRALISVEYETEYCKHRSDIFTSENISCSPKSLSMQSSAIHKYIDLLPRAKLLLDKDLSEHYFSNCDEDEYLWESISYMDIGYFMEGVRKECDDKDSDDGFDGVGEYWYEYHKHD